MPAIIQQTPLSRGTQRRYEFECAKLIVGFLMQRGKSTDDNDSKKPDERGKGRGEEESEDEETDEEMDTGYAYDLLAPDREPNPARLYIPFEEFFIVEDLRELLQPQSPPLPAALVSHDVLAGEWDRCMLSMVRFTFQAVRSTGSGALDLLLDFVTQWNIKFFLPRGVDIGVYKGNSRRSGPVGMIDIRSKLHVFSNKLESASGVRKRLRGVSIRARVVIINPVAGPDSGTTPKEPAGKEVVYYDENSANPLPPRSEDENPDGAGLPQQIPGHETNWPRPFYLFEEFFVVEDLTELLHPQRPPLPAVLVPCDVMRDEWDRFMAGIVHFAFPTGRSTGSSVPGPLVGLIADWNIKFFLPRMVDVSIYKGNSRLSGPPSMITVKSGLRVLSSESESVSDAGRRQRGVSIRIRAVLINPMAGFDSSTTAKEPTGEEVVYDNENSANPLEPKDTTKSADDNHNKEPDEQGKGEEAEGSEDENPDADDVGRFWPIPDRELNRAQPFTLFEEFFVVEDLVELLHPQRPPLPAVLVTHDVMRDEWDRCMESVIHLAFPGGLTYGGASDRLIDLITQWNIKFFLPRVVDIGIYKDNTRLSGPANMINIDSRSRVSDDEPGSKPSASGQQVTGVSIRVRAVPSNEPVFVPVAYSRLQMK
ncbi:hypothetical protein FRC12_018336 [Ceratobasidium sp. 428]|nr:hypothetical protein FRC12_018336 [Ceratobasidium sp. 428]